MKKVVLAVLAVMCVASFSFAGNWGLGLKAGAGENDWKTYGSTDVDKGYGFAGAEILYEFDTSSNNKIGLKVGVEAYQKDKASFSGIDTEVKTWNCPVTLYYKWDKGVNAFSYFLGGGFTYINSRWHDSSAVKYTHSKGMAHLMAGTEYRFTQGFALGVDVTYNIDAGLQAGEVSDRTGFRGALVGRFYF